MSSQQLEVHIMGQSYLLKCPTGGEAQFQTAVHKVDAAMCKIRDAGKIKARERIAVLAALNLAFETPAKRPPPLMWHWMNRLTRRENCVNCWPAWTRFWATTVACSDAETTAAPKRRGWQTYNACVCKPIGLYISLNQCSLEPGLGTSADERDRLASDEPNVSLPSPT